jgi:hypothetical protein
LFCPIAWAIPKIARKWWPDWSDRAFWIGAFLPLEFMIGWWLWGTIYYWVSPFGPKLWAAFWAIAPLCFFTAYFASPARGPIYLP